MHVVARGVRREAIFYEDDDYQVFMMIVQKSARDMNFTINAYCLMTNHFHFLISTQDVSISLIMKHIMYNYARFFNQKYGFSGHLFESRFSSYITDDPAYFLAVSRYIHMNPVKANMVKKPADYEYSSYKAFLSDEVEDALDKDKVLAYFSNDRKVEYRKFVEYHVIHEEYDLSDE